MFVVKESRYMWNTLSNAVVADVTSLSSFDWIV